MSKHNDAHVRAMFRYDPISGIVRRLKVASGKKAQIGAVVGNKTNLGYLVTQFEGKQIPVHHLAWFLSYGVWPKELDHKDNDRANNSLSNLRGATRAQNMANRKDYGAGVRGVQRRGSSFRVITSAGGKRINLGTYQTEQEAVEVLKKYHIETYGEFSPYKRGE